MRRVLVIGIGNRERGDDAVGPTAAEAIGSLKIPGVDTLCSRGDPAELIDAWAGRRHIVIIDACQSGTGSGTVHRFDAGAAPLPSQFGAVSTHGFGLGAAIEMARAMAALPDDLVVYGVEAASFDPGAPLTAPVARAAQSIVGRILEEIAGKEKDVPCTKRA